MNDRIATFLIYVSWQLKCSYQKNVLTHIFLYVFQLFLPVGKNPYSKSCALVVDEWCGDGGRHHLPWHRSCNEAKKGKPSMYTVCKDNYLNDKSKYIHFCILSLLLQGSAVFWYNLHKNGELDLNTRHAGCPVLVGNKWGRFCFVFK